MAMFALSILIQLTQLALMLSAKREKPVSLDAALTFLKNTRTFGVRKLTVGGICVELEPLVSVPTEMKIAKTPAEMKQDEEDLLLHSVRP